MPDEPKTLSKSGGGLPLRRIGVSSFEVAGDQGFYAKQSTIAFCRAGGPRHGAPETGDAGSTDEGDLDGRVGLEPFDVS